MTDISYRRHRFPPIVIQHAVWLYLRFTLSYRDVEELLAERGLDVSYESVRRKGWSRISCAPTALPSDTSGLPATMSRACDRTIGPRTRTRWCDDESASCSASNHRAPLSDSSACMLLSTTHLTFNGILSLDQLFGSSDQMRLRNGAPRPQPHEAEPVAPHLGRNGST